MTTDDEWVEPEPHPLWEYPAYPRSKVHELMNFDLAAPVPNKPIKVAGTIDLTSGARLSGERESNGVGGGGGRGGGGREGGREESCNAVVMWLDYQLSEQHVTTTGLIQVIYNVAALHGVRVY